MGVIVRGDKWTNRNISRLKSYAESVERPNVSGLAKALGVSRQCIYDWALCHQNFRMALNEMRHGAINRIHVSAEDFMDDIDIMELERKENVAKKKRKNKRKTETKVVSDGNNVVNHDSTVKPVTKDMVDTDATTQRIEFEDELGNDDDWIIDDSDEGL